MIELNKRNRIILIVGVTCIISALVFKAVRGSCSDVYSDFFIEGFDGLVLEKKRIPEQHNALYAKGRTAPGRVVTNAKGGQSNHNFGLSMDVAIFENGKYLSNGSEWQYERFGEIAEANGLEWGGRWKTPFDPAHVQIKHGYTMDELHALPKNKKGFILAPLIKSK